LLTGAPGVGKSTLRKALTQRLPNLRAFDYGRLLLERRARMGVNFSHEELREHSAAVISPSDVNNVDEEVIENVRQLRKDSHIILDSHAFTAEEYGLRAVPYSLQQLQKLELDAVLVLHCKPSILNERTRKKPDGRRDVGIDLLGQLQTLQEAVGVVYSIASGCPIYIIDVSGKSESEVLDASADIFSALGMGSQL
jgi:adenylate kinase